MVSTVWIAVVITTPCGPRPVARRLEDEPGPWQLASGPTDKLFHTQVVPKGGARRKMEDQCRVAAEKEAAKPGQVLVHDSNGWHFVLVIANFLPPNQ
jgi:hypothetical protein